MKRILIIIFLTTIGFGTQAYAFQCESDKMSTELEKAYQADQEIRKEMMAIVAEYQETGNGVSDLLRMKGEMDAIDKKNRELLFSWMEKCGWPEDLKPIAHQAVFMILHHGELEDMKPYIEEVKEKSEAGLLDKDDYAMMSDRIAMYEGRHQTYGTQTFQTPNSVNTVWPVRDIASLDSLRSDVGLPAMQEYFRVARDSMDVTMVMDSTLTLEEARRLRGFNN